MMIAYAHGSCDCPGYPGQFAQSDGHVGGQHDVSENALLNAPPPHFSLYKEKGELEGKANGMGGGEGDEKLEVGRKQISNELCK